MMSYIASFFQRDEEEYKAACKSREIYEQIFMKFYSSPLNIKCSAPNCLGWKCELAQYSPSRAYCYRWEACTHRQRRGLEARKKDMLPGDIKKAEDRLFDWKAYREKQRLEQERKNREKVNELVLKQSDVLGEWKRSSTCNKCGEKH